MNIANILKHHSIFIQRMGRQIDTNQFTFLVQPFQITPGWSRYDFRSGNFHLMLTAEQGIDGSRLVHLVLTSITDQSFYKGFILGIFHKEILPLDISKAVKTSGQCQVFNILPVTSRKIHTLYKIKDALVRTILLAFTQNALHSRLTDSLDCSQSETDVTPTVNRELQQTFVHIRTKHPDTSCLRLVHQFRDFSDVRNVSAHGGRHILRRIICFQISSLISNPGITGGMRFIERIRSKFFPVSPDLLKNLRIVSILLSTFDKLRLHVIQLVAQLLTHCLSQGI